MHPAPSIILFTVLSGLGFGLLSFLGLGLVQATGWAAFAWFALGYGLSVAGLSLSAFHLGHPERALKAFTQWRTSWLSREAVLSTAALLFMAPHAAGLVFFATPLSGFGILGAFLCLQTVLATAMIYAQLKTVPRWNHWLTPLLFLTASLAGGALLIGAPRLAQVLLAALALVMVAYWLIGDSRLRASGSTIGSATGLGARGAVRQLEPPHTGPNYLLREMVYVVGRKHALRLRGIALVLAVVLPSLILWAAPEILAARVLAALSHLAGMMAARWLFFAEAEHVVGLYYGRRAA